MGDLTYLVKDSFLIKIFSGLRSKLQTEITDLYSELSYDELKDVLEGWLNPSKTSKNEEGESSVAEETLSKKPTEEVNDLPFDVEDDKPKTSKKTDDVAAAFDDLFNN